MQPFQQRVVTERDELALKLGSLKVFLQGETFKTLKQIDKNLLFRQRDAMEYYLEILEERIARFPL